MDRLTIQYDGDWVPKEMCTIDRYGKADDCDVCSDYCEFRCEECPVQKCFNRLAKYENIRLTPDEIKSLLRDGGMKMAIRNRELREELGVYRKKYNDGLMIELPCRVGDTVYILTTDSPSGIETTKISKIVLKKNTYRIIAPCVCNDWGNARWDFSKKDFNERWFLTREEAEKELDKR